MRQIARITTAGVISEYPVQNGVYEIAAGPDGALWFTTALAAKIGRITTSGAITEYTVPYANADPVSITAGSDGNLWFTDPDNNAVVQVVLEK